MSAIARLDIREQSRLLNLLATTGPDFFSTNTAPALLHEIRHYFAPAAIATSKRMGFGLEVDDVINMMVANLLDHGGDIAARAAAASNPFGYLNACLQRWCHHVWGVRSASLVEYGLEEETMGGFAITSDVYSFSKWPMDETPSSLTSVSECIELTYEALSRHITTEQVSNVYELVEYFAQNPPQRRSYEGHDVVDAIETFTHIQPEHVQAVKNITWGVRPRQDHTSLLGAFLKDASFIPENSSTHYQALLVFRQRMNMTASHSLEKAVA